jgi:plastocyanin
MIDLRFTKKSTITILTIFVIVLLGIVIYLILIRGMTDTESSGTNRTHVIQFGDDGFLPTEITIQKGETVKFTTTRDKHFWPASNIHPIHEIYPEFDPREPISPKDSWSFRFDAIGQWKYHDHLAPYYTGTIIVL